MKWESYSHPISDVRDWNKNKRLELRPDFQRNEVWSKSAQIKLIETIIRGIPIPKIYIKSIMKSGDTYRIVIDGQQRLTAILKFVNDTLKLSKPYEGEYSGKTFSELPDDIQNEILRYKIDINEIFNPTDDEIRDLYARVNKYTVQLNKQELRKADFMGDYINLAERLSELEFFSSSKIFSVKQRRRMLDVEFVIELLCIITDGIQDKKDFLDDICEKYIEMDNSEAITEIFLSVINDISTLFDEKSLSISSTRFKQKSDFYSLFACVYNHKINNDKIHPEKLNDVRKYMKDLSDRIEPHSDNEEYRNYAMRCLSDANSIGSRKWRVKFIDDYISVLYGSEVE